MGRLPECTASQNIDTFTWERNDLLLGVASKTAPWEIHPWSKLLPKFAYGIIFWVTVFDRVFMSRNFSVNLSALVGKHIPPKLRGLWSKPTTDSGSLGVVTKALKSVHYHYVALQIQLTGSSAARIFRILHQMCSLVSRAETPDVSRGLVELF